MGFAMKNPAIVPLGARNAHRNGEMGRDSVEVRLVLQASAATSGTQFDPASTDSGFEGRLLECRRSV